MLAYQCRFAWRLVSSPAIFFLIAWPLTSQQPPQQTTKRGLIAGVVVDTESGKPLGKARLLLRQVGSRDRPLASRTLSDGKFVLLNIEPGRYRLSAQRNLYAQQEYGQSSSSRSGTVLTVKPGQRVEGIVFRLVRAGVIVGRVVDEDNEPMPGVEVEAMRSRYVEGKRQLAPFGRASTNDRGEYRIFGLSPGRYRVRAVLSLDDESWARPASGSRGSSGRLGYIPIYYPGVFDSSQAIAVDVASGSEVFGVDVQLRPARTVRISGVVLNAISGRAARQAIVMLAPRRSSWYGFSSSKQVIVQDREERFEIHGVTPGAYTLIGQVFDSPERLGGRLSLDVDQRDIEGIRLVVSPGVNLPGQILVEGAAEADLEEVRVFLQPREFTMMGMAPANVNAGGSFVLKSVFRDVYDINLFGAPENFYLSSARWAGRQVLEDGLDLTSTEASTETLQLVLDPSGGRVDGVVLNEDDQPVSGAQIVLVPEERHRKQRYLYKDITSDQNGGFSLRSIKPGTYKIFAWEDVEKGAWEDPEFLRAYEKSGEPCRIRESSALNLELRLIPAAGDFGNQ